MPLTPGCRQAGRLPGRVVLLTVALLAGCGFALRGAIDIPFASLYVDIPEHSAFGSQLKRAIAAQRSTRLAASGSDAEAILTPTGEARDKSILSLNSAGRVREYRLHYRYSFRVHDPAGRDLIEPASIALTRDMTFDDSAVLAKAQEEALLWRDMESDLVHQILRRLARPAPTGT
jgi:LPS-assembly lipoprotein